MNRKKLTPFLLLLPFLILSATAVSAVYHVIIQSLGYVPAFGLKKITLFYYRSLLHRAGFLQSLQVSLRIAVYSAVIAAAGGVLVCAVLIARKKTSGAMLYLVRLPILVPHTVAALFTINLLSQNGLAARLAYAFGWIPDSSHFFQLLYTPNNLGVILAYVWKELPFIAYFVLALMSGISNSYGEAAENLGATPVKRFFQITLPLSMPAICKGFLIIFVYAFGGYELPLLLGATKPKALPVQAYIEFINPDLLNRPYAMAMNGVILIVSVFVASGYFLGMRKMLRRLRGAQ